MTHNYSHHIYYIGQVQRRTPGRRPSTERSGRRGETKRTVNVRENPVLLTVRDSMILTLRHT